MRLTILACLISLPLVPALAQSPDGEALFGTHCAACHAKPTEEKTPTRAAMATLTPNAIVEALTDGAMRIQGQPLTPAERTAIAERVTGRPVVAASRATGAGLCAAGAAFSPVGSTQRCGTAGAPTRTTRGSRTTPAAFPPRTSGN